LGEQTLASNENGLYEIETYGMNLFSFVLNECQYFTFEGGE